MLLSNLPQVVGFGRCKLQKKYELLQLGGSMAGAVFGMWGTLPSGVHDSIRNVGVPINSLADLGTRYPNMKALQD